MLFDIPEYQKINEARWPLVARVIVELRDAGLELNSAYDVGCGPGWFSGHMAQMGFERTTGFDGRAEVVNEARARTPSVEFRQFDFDAEAIDATPSPADFTLALGLLYHLESPVRALRMFAAMTKNALLLETITMPCEEPLGRLVRENRNETQGVRDCALILSRSAVVMGLRAAGLDHIYWHPGELDHDDFRETESAQRRRHIFLATRSQVSITGFEAANDEVSRANYWRR